MICPGRFPSGGTHTKERSDQETAIHQVYRNWSFFWWRTMRRIIDDRRRLTGINCKCIIRRQNSNEFLLLSVRRNKICDFLGFVSLDYLLFILTATHAL